MVERFQHDIASSVSAPGTHGPQCQCMTCKWDEYKKQNGQFGMWNWAFLSYDYSSIGMGALAGSLLTLLGVALFKHWRQAAFGGISSCTPSTKMFSGDPNILVNNATDSIHNIVTVDPSLGILYAPITGIYKINLFLNLVLEESVTTNQVIRILVAKNGLPTDSAATLFAVDEVLVPDSPLSLSIHGFRMLKSDDYLQVFAIFEEGSIPVTSLAFDFSMDLAKVQREV